VNGSERDPEAREALRPAATEDRRFPVREPDSDDRRPDADDRGRDPADVADLLVSLAIVPEPLAIGEACLDAACADEVVVGARSLDREERGRAGEEARRADAAL
jgi:hypothetical protein